MNKKKIQSVFVDSKDEYTILVDNIKLSFIHYPFKIELNNKIKDLIYTPDLKTLAALKAYALSRRSKWKDYVDLYFIFKSGLSLNQLIQRANKIFADNFNEKIFRSQLAYYDDIDYSESINYLPDFKVSKEEIQKELSKISLE